MHRFVLWLLPLVIASCSGLNKWVQRAADTDERTRRKAVLTIGERLREIEPGPRSDREQEAVDLLVRLATQDPDPAVRAAAIQELGRLKDDAGPEPYLAGLRDGHWMVRLEAIRALIAHPAPQAPEIIAGLLAQDREESFFVRLEAVEAVVAHRAQIAIPELFRIFVDDVEEYRLRYKAYEALRALTGVDHSYRSPAWTDWYEAWKKGAGRTPP